MNKRDADDLAMRRIRYLADLSRRQNELRLAQRYVCIARNIGKRMDITLPVDIKRSFCKRCNTPYGSGSTIRLKNRILTITCSVCGDRRRIPY
ncbi:MAG: ribonuclease P protein component 4 [Thermoplasmata archaeon]